MKIPEFIERSRTFQKLSGYTEFVDTIRSIREIAEALGRQIERLLPEYTDHSLRHMDALWCVADAVLLPAETQRCTPEEIFILGCTFYVHDLGMALASTKAGVTRLKLTTAFQSAERQLRNAGTFSKEQVEIGALRSAARDQHANVAPSLVLEQLPGLGRYLIEKSEIRDKWANMIGEISASHHWKLQDVEKRLGRRSLVPTADGGSVDLAFIACLLRIIDYAHINRERALPLELALRSEMSDASSQHWKAQASITGPTRENTQLVYGCTSPISEIEAWWLFYDMASGLDTEIRSVRDYLEGRNISSGRLSLHGVRGVESPETFSSYVQLDSEIAPVDIRVQPHSMERVIDILGGDAIYRGDTLAPIRELIQNARDAITLRRALDAVEDRDNSPGRIEISLDYTKTPSLLKVRDNGIGMTRGVVKNHLISVASDFWNSVEFGRDFSKVIGAGFKPIGRFGIGFLSVFMLGTYVEVETERIGSPRIELRLRGIGRRGEIREKMSTGSIGTEVRIQLSPHIAKMLTALPEVVKARAPMLPIPIFTKIVTNEGTSEMLIEPGWWDRATSAELEEFLTGWEKTAKAASASKSMHHIQALLLGQKYQWRPGRDQLKLGGWPGARPQASSETGRIIAEGFRAQTGILQCSHGIAIAMSATHDTFGLIENGDVILTPDRSSLDEDEAASSHTLATLREALLPEIRNELNNLERYGLIPARHDFLRRIAMTYGIETLAQSSLRWIPTLGQPGDLIHKSRDELRARLESEPSVIICTGVSPGEAYGLLAPTMEASELSRTVGVLLSTNEFSIDYTVAQKVEVEQGTSKLSGNLGEIIDRASLDRKEMVLLEIILRTIQEAWSIPIDRLESQTWTLNAHTLHGYLWTHLRRSQPKLGKTGTRELITA